MAAIKKRSRPMITALIGHATGVELKDGQAIIRFPAGAGSFKTQAEREETLALLKECATEAGGRSLTLRIEMEDETGDRSGGGGKTSERGRPDNHRRQLLEAAGSDPTVKHLLREFGAQIVDIRPLDPEAGTEEMP